MHQGLERYTRDPGFVQNSLRDSGNVNGIRDLIAGLAEIWARGNWQENVIRDGDDKSLGYQIIVKKERESGSKTPLTCRH